MLENQYSTDEQGQGARDVKGSAPRRRWARKKEQTAAYSPDTELFYVPTDYICMDYEPFKVNYTAGQPYVGATLSIFPPPGK